jgi:hypothetical protein
LLSLSKEKDLALRFTLKLEPDAWALDGVNPKRVLAMVAGEWLDKGEERCNLMSVLEVDDRPAAESKV